MVGWLKYRKGNEQNSVKPDRLVLHKKDGSIVQMIWDSITPVKTVGQFMDCSVAGVKFIAGEKEQEPSIRQFLSDLKDIKLITTSGHADLVQVNIVDGRKPFYLIKTDMQRLMDKWMKGGKIRFSERYWVAVYTSLDGQYQCALYDNHISEENPVLVEAYGNIPAAFELQHERNTFRLLTIENSLSATT